jgi:hypothetical protein
MKHKNDEEMNGRCIAFIDKNGKEKAFVSKQLTKDIIVK